MNREMVCVAYCVHDDHAYLAQSIESFKEAGDVIVFVSREPWHDAPGDWEQAAEAARAAGAEVVLGEWRSELEHRTYAREYLLGQGYRYAFIPDGDEIVEPGLLQALCKVAEARIADRVYVEWDTYWKSPEYVIRPRERFTPLLLVNMEVAKPVRLRDFEGGRPLFLGAEHGIVHHLSYVGPDARIRRKIATWGHAAEVVPGWYENVWLQWDSNKLLRNLHPTHPPAYGFAERIDTPEVLLPALARHRELRAGEAAHEPPSLSLDVPGNRPSVSVVIPVHGGADDLRACLDSLEKCPDLLHEVVVVDNASPDGAAEVAESCSFVHLLRNETNRGFAAACNQGIAETTGEVVLFLNSDTVVPRAGLVRLLGALQKSGSIAAAGPYTNRSGHLQQIEPTYTSLDRLDLFAQDFAARDAEDVEVDMLVGFCLAVKRAALQEVGSFDERFGLGTFEDNDVCYRLRRAGYRLVIAAHSFVHHEGSKTLGRVQADVGSLLRMNEGLYRAKWREDLESGFASTLSGLVRHPAERIVFDQSKRPDVRVKRVADLARRVGISLCMIVKDEERVLADALRTARPFFSEMIVVETGSTDRTAEIAEEAGAQVFPFPWTDSFAEARNESLSHATGRWVFWMDADDTLPWSSGEALLQAALNAPKEVAGFVVPVQFVDDGTRQGGAASGTRVDHVKLFRNLPGLRFEGRIHEQILPSLRAVGGEHGGQIARCGAVVMHSGYDTSERGQARKRERDMRLLKLDLSERPNHPFVLFNIGMTYHYTGEHRRAVRWLKQCLRASRTEESHVRKAYAMLAVSMRELGQPAEALETLENGLAAVPGDPELHFQAGLLLTHMERPEEAIVHYKQVLGRDISGHFSSVDIGILGFKTHHNLAGLYHLTGRYATAREHWLQAINEAPDFLPSALELFNTALDVEDLPTAKRVLEAIRQTEGPDGNWTGMAARYAEAVGGPENVEAFLRRAVQQEPDALAARLILARRLLNAGREEEALEHLLPLNDAGIAEAAYFLGIIAIRRDKLASALAWMERARQLNPDHVETRQQVDNLRRALEETCPPTTEAVPLEEAVRKLAEDFGLDPAALMEYAQEDPVGGYGQDEPVEGERRWPGGSVWDVEGRTLYALVRAIKPQILVEIGSLVGCSTSHLAEACRRNGFGTIYAVDPYADFSRVRPERLPFIVPVKEDVLAWPPPAQIDFVFEDGTHEPGFTRQVLERLKPHLSPGAAVLCHDFHNGVLGPDVSAEFRQVMAGVSQTHGSILITPSNCGLGYALVGKMACDELVA